MSLMYSLIKPSASTFVFGYDAHMDEPPKRQRGRKPLSEGMDTVPFVVRMTTAQRDKLNRLGGAKWVRDKIDRAKETS